MYGQKQHFDRQTKTSKSESVCSLFRIGRKQIACLQDLIRKRYHERHSSVWTNHGITLAKLVCCFQHRQCIAMLRCWGAEEVMTFLPESKPELLSHTTTYTSYPGFACESLLFSVKRVLVEFGSRLSHSTVRTQHGIKSIECGARFNWRSNNDNCISIFVYARNTTSHSNGS